MLANVTVNWKQFIAAATAAAVWAAAHLDMFPTDWQDEVQVVTGIVVAISLYLAKAPGQGK